MQVRDLMIGDWVQANSGYAKVTAVGEEGVHFEDKFGHGIASGIEPIPITKEILKKNGFKDYNKTGNAFVIGEYSWGDKGKRNFTDVTITFYDGLDSGVRFLTKISSDCSYESGINMIHSCDIEYVHQLQHALKLNGIEKEIIL